VRLVPTAKQHGGTVSFYLFAWHEPMPLTGEEAAQKLDVAFRNDDHSAFRPHPNVRAYQAALFEEYPPLELLDANDPRAVWMHTPPRSDQLIEMCTSWSAQGVVDLAVDLAEQFDLVLFNPQNGSIYLPSILARTLRLIAGPGQELTNPEADVIAYRVRKALAGGHYALLESDFQQFVEAAGGGLGAADGYELVYRGGPGLPHYRASGAGLSDVLAVFDAFARDDESYRTLLDWQPHHVGPDMAQ
jgi:hypothetical protein